MNAALQLSHTRSHAQWIHRQRRVDIHNLNRHPGINIYFYRSLTENDVKAARDVEAVA